LLEKHKDYSLRAQDYNAKKKKLTLLSQKARERNPDEFAFGMLSQGKAGLGKHQHKQKGGDVDNTSLSHDAVKLLKTQDAGYLRTVAARGRKEIERTRQEVGMDEVMLDGSIANKRQIFADRQTGEFSGKKCTANGEVLDTVANVLSTPQRPNLEEAPLHPRPDPEVPDDDGEGTLRKARSKKALAAEQNAVSRLKAERKKRQRLQEMRAAKLEALKTRQREILAAADQLDLQRAKMARTVGGVNKNGVKFKIRERKR